MADTATSENVFRVTPDGKYIHNNQEVTKQEFDARKAAADAAIKQMRGPDRSKMSLKERAKAAFDEDGFKKGGAVKSASARADGCCIRGKTRA